MIFTHQVPCTASVLCIVSFYFWVKPALQRHRAIGLHPIRPLDTNKRLMLLLVAMDHGCLDIVWCSWRMLKLSEVTMTFLVLHTDMYLSKHSQHIKQHFLISFHTHILTKSGKVRGWKEGGNAFTQFITGHPSLRCFCPRLTLYVVPCQPGALCPVKLISLFRILSKTLNFHTHARTHTNYFSGNCPSGS